MNFRSFKNGLMVMFCAALVHAAIAQTTDFNIQSGTADLEQEYRQELDKWMLRAYEGDRDAQFKVGVLFTNKQFEQPDYEQAVYWYRQAARQGHVLAQYNLGHQYLMGVGVEKDEDTAMQWWLQAADQDHALAQFNIGRAYYLGIGLEEDHKKSKYWFNRAAYNQEPKSIQILQQLGWSDTEESLVASAPQLNNADEATQRTQLTSKIIPAVEPQPVIAETPAPAPQQAATAPTPTVASTTDKPGTPTALYTDPKVRSVLISIIDDRNTLEVEKRGDDWVTVTSTEGFPVWVHGDFINIDGDNGTITGNSVNARSVPIITNGTVVGRLNKQEQVAVLDKRKEWYRIVAPKRFQAWVKVEDFDRAPVVETPLEQIAQASLEQVEEPAAPIETKDAASTTESTDGADKKPLSTSTAEAKSGVLPNDNEWLYSQPKDSYTLQLASFDDPNEVQAFVARKQFTDNPDLHQFSSSGKNIRWIYFLYGSYENREAADTAKEEIKQKRAWVRTFGMLQQNRCVAWKKQLPAPPELNKYCAS